jgi:FKBP-type peptidyl-prolyl cis-trans isomerase 2
MNFISPPFVTLHYKLSIFEEGKSESLKTIFDTFTASPATIQVGSGYFPDCLDRVLVEQISDKKETFSVRIPSENAYGKRNRDLVQTVSTSLLQPADPQKDEYPAYQAGDVVQVVFPNQQRIAGTFLHYNHAQSPDQCAIDFNHPLAGYDLLFEGKIFGVMS